MIRINQVKLPVKTDPMASGLLKKQVCGLLKLKESHILSLEILRRSIDARKRPDFFFSYTVLAETDLPDEAALVKRLRNRDILLQERVRYQEPVLQQAARDRMEEISQKSSTGAEMPQRETAEAEIPQSIKAEAGIPQSMKAEEGVPQAKTEEAERPIVAGFGPAGMFAALVLARAGARPLIYERGGRVEERVRDVELLWKEGRLDPDSNPQFGEGGAGTFSDGKLNTLTKDREGRSRYVLEEFIRFGADAEILTDAKPHVGTDRLVDIVRGIRQEIEALGGEFRFHEKFHYTGQKHVILAIGHSARDTYQELYEAGLPMEAKDFAMGLRVQHPQTMINEALYGVTDPETLKALGPGAYKVTHTCENGRGVYSFCMCPGGYVVNSSSEEGRLCVNGMSYHDRDGVNANAAIIVTVRRSDFHGEEHPLNGLRLQRQLEEKAFQLGEGRIPVQLYGDFRKQQMSRQFGEVQPAFRGQFVFAPLHTLFSFPEGSEFASLNDFRESIAEGMEGFARQIRGFDREDAILAGVEARTSSPVRIPRDGSMQSGIPGIYPCGEGAGYAGGIMSAAMDGMRAAEALVRDLNILYD